MKYRNISVLFLFVIVLVVALLFIEKIPPDALTQTRMIGIQQRIGKYFEDNGSLPMSLSDLQERPGYDNSIKDGWGSNIQYNVVDDTIVVLKSFGKDRKEGGDGKNADIVGRFNLKYEFDFPFTEGEEIERIERQESRLISPFIKIHLLATF